MRPLLLAFACALATPVAHAACTFTPGPGNDAHVCDSGSAPDLLDTTGDNSLTLPAGGDGAILGDVTFGNGADRLDMASGSIGGNLNQGAGIDDFVMSGGVIEGNLNQGDSLDTFFMSGGWIKGTFDSGDYAEMDGGRIGNVNMRLDKNTFIMRGGSIDRNLITAFDQDYVEIFAGTIGGNISVSGGDDQVLVHGGRIAGNVLVGPGNDRFTWDGGEIGGFVDLGPGDDSALVRGLDSAVLVTALDGGTGVDSLTFDASQTQSGALYTGWETLALSNGSRFTLNDALRLGDLDTASGVLTIDASSSLVSRSGNIGSFVANGRSTLINAGLIDLSSGNDGQGRLTVQGDYLGNGGTLRLNSVLAGDDAPSDRLVVSQGDIRGSTLLHVNNLAGAGAATSGNGIQVVEARDGATSTAGAFVQAQVLSAGAYDYRLFKGGLEAGSEANWYLRSTLVAPASGVAIPEAAPAPGQPDLPAPTAGRAVPLYRPEVPLYAAAPRGAALMARLALGTFHQRQGDQRVLDAESVSSWGQAYGGAVRQQWSGTVNPSLDGDLYGFKVGQDIYAQSADQPYRQRVGLYLAHARLDADVEGFALGRQDSAAGDLKLDADSLGVYWTLVGPQRAYLDAVLHYTHLDGRAASDRGDKLDIDGHAWTASLETGLPMALSERWSIEPQAQLIAQKVSLDSASDRVSRVEHDAQVEMTGRLGLRLEGLFSDTAGRLLQPYAQLNLWHGDGGRDTLTFAGTDRIKTDYRSTSLQAESGVVTQLGAQLSLHAGVQYSTHLDSREQRSRGANLGLRWQF